MTIFLVSLLMRLALPPGLTPNRPQPGCLEAAEAARGCGRASEGHRGGHGGWQLRAEAQDVCQPAGRSTERMPYPGMSGGGGGAWHQRGRKRRAKKGPDGNLVLPLDCFGSLVK